MKKKEYFTSVHIFKADGIIAPLKLFVCLFLYRFDINNIEVLSMCGVTSILSVQINSWRKFVDLLLCFFMTDTNSIRRKEKTFRITEHHVEKSKKYLIIWWCLCFQIFCVIFVIVAHIHTFISTIYSIICQIISIDNRHWPFPPPLSLFL